MFNFQLQMLEIAIAVLFYKSVPTCSKFEAKLFSILDYYIFRIDGKLYAYKHQHNVSKKNS